MSPNDTPLAVKDPFRILVADDNESILQLIAAALRIENKQPTPRGSNWHLDYACVDYECNGSDALARYQSAQQSAQQSAVQSALQSAQQSAPAKRFLRFAVAGLSNARSERLGCRASHPRRRRQDHSHRAVHGVFRCGVTGGDSRVWDRRGFQENRCHLRYCGLAR